MPEATNNHAVPLQIAISFKPREQRIPPSDISIAAAMTESTVEFEVVEGGEARTYKLHCIGGTVTSRAATAAEERFAAKVAQLYAEKAEGVED